MPDSTTCSSACTGGLLLLLRSLRPTEVEHRHEWLFSALAYGRKDLVAKGDPDFNWNESHPHFGTPLHAIGGKGIRLRVDGYPSYNWTPDSNECIKDLYALFEFAMKRGADPTVICPRSCSGCVRFEVRGTQGPSRESVLYDLTEPIGGRSAISLWLALSQRARELDNSNPEQLPLASAFFDGILSLLLHVVPKHKGFAPEGPLQPAMVSVPQATTEVWQQVLENEETCDVVFRCADGDVCMHSAVVASSSRVLSAMLRWPHDDEEAPEHCLQVSQVEQGVPKQQVWPPMRRRVLSLANDRREAVLAWRHLVYIGLPPHAVELTTEMLLDVLDLSHRWQDHLLQSGFLVAALAQRVVDGDSCSIVLDAAVARDLPDLRGECLAFARRSREVRHDWENGRFTGEVAKQLDAVFGVARFAHGSARSSRGSLGGAFACRGGANVASGANAVAASHATQSGLFRRVHSAGGGLSRSGTWDF